MCKNSIIWYKEIPLLEHNFYVFTDHVKMEKMIDGNVNVRQFPENDLQGWWNKMQLFHPGVIRRYNFIYGFRCCNYR